MKKPKPNTYVDNVQGSVKWVANNWAEVKAREFNAIVGKVLRDPTLTKTQVVHKFKAKGVIVAHRVVNQARNLALGQIDSRKEALGASILTQKRKLQDNEAKIYKKLQSNLWSDIRWYLYNANVLKARIVKLEHALLRMETKSGICLGRQYMPKASDSAADKLVKKVKLAWKRSSHFGATGSYEEPHGNAYQLRLNEAVQV